MFRRILSTLAVAALLPAALVAQAPQADTGDADFTRYVAIGDSLTAAYWSGGLHEAVQRHSYPALIYRQVHGTTQGFEQPLVSAPGIPGVLELRSLSPLVIAPKPGNGQPLNLTLARPYDNLAVPGFRTHDVVVTKTGNVIIDLILRNAQPPGFTALEQALALQPTFATVWIGNNDVLAAATSGIVIEGVTLTPRASFEADLRTIVGALAARGAQLAIANLPNVTAIPFVNTLPPVVVNPATSQPVLINGQPVPLIGPQGPLAPNDKVLLSASAYLAQGIGIPAQLGGSGQPLPNSAVLNAAEVNAIQTRVNELNQVIGAVADEAGAALIDINGFFSDVASEGYMVGGVELTNAFLTGGIFSYDGVHANPVGYAAVANLFIEAINDTFDADIPLVSLYPYAFEGVGLPTLAASAVTPAQAASAVFSFKAYEQLRKALRIPSTDRLEGMIPDGGDDPGAPRPGKPQAPVTGKDLSGSVNPRG